MAAELTPNALRVLEVRYLRRDPAGHVVETPAQLFERVARAVAEAELIHGTAAEARRWEARFHEMLSGLDFLPNSPTLMNAGTSLGQLSACFVLPVEDTMESIFGTLRDMALVQRTGGGTGFSFSRLRPAGDHIVSTGGTASGPLSFMAIYDCATENIKLGGRRRGANMGVLRVDHPDIRAFIDAKRDGATLRNFNISVGVTDAFMAALATGADFELRHPVDGRVTGRVPARALFDAICDAAWATGDPGLIFLDTIARGNPTPAAGAIEATNPCITGDALIFTADGLRRAADLAADGAPVRVVVEASDAPRQASPVFSVGRRPVFRLDTIEGYSLRLTADHRVQTMRGWVPAAELRTGDRICLLSHRAAFGTGGSLALGRALGSMVGEGTFDQAANSAILRFDHRDRTLAHASSLAVQEPVLDSAVRGTSKTDRVRVIHDERANGSNVDAVQLARLLADVDFTAETRLMVPDAVLTGSEEMQRGFLQGLFTADGHIDGRQVTGVSVRLTSVCLSLLQDVQRMLLAFGIASTIDRNRRPGGSRLLPDGHGGRALYETQPYHDLVISQGNLKTFAAEIGFLRADMQEALTHCLAAYKRRLNRETFTARFHSLTPDGDEEVYDLIEPCTHSFVANGFVVHNCGEVPLLPYESCNLGSINLAHLVVERDGVAQVDWERLRRLAHDGMRFLDDVITVNRYPLAPTAEITQANRKVGLGVMGFAEMLILLGISYASSEAVRFAGELMAFIAREAQTASVSLAEERGVFPNWDRSVFAGQGPRVRNATQTSIAPTGTISIIAGTSSSIEPLFALAYRRNVLGGETLTELNPLLVRHLERLGSDGAALLAAVERGGRLEDVPQASEDLRRLFVTALDVPAEQHVRIQAAFQQHVDNAVSKTVNLPAEAAPADIAAVYRLAYQLGCKGVTVFRYGSKPAQVLELGVDETPIEREHFTKCDPNACRL
jgi:ribonucleoside-diphosphate reductase alpha chain